MYLSKITVEDARVWFLKSRKFNSALFREHQMIWGLFGNAADQRRDFLYRREHLPGRLPFFYVLSERKPEYGDNDLSIQSKSFHPELQAGDQLRFSLRANAVITRKVADSKKRIRRDIIEAKVDDYKAKFSAPADRPPPAVIHHEAARDWLDKQQEQYGFTVQEFSVENHALHRVKKPDDPNIRQFVSHDFYGLLVVHQPDKFAKVLTNGLGRSKAYGCGLFLVRRVSNADDSIDCESDEEI